MIITPLGRLKKTQPTKTPAHAPRRKGSNLYHSNSIDTLMGKSKYKQLIQNNLKNINNMNKL